LWAINACLPAKSVLVFLS